jgi:hypothetical protein
MEASTTTTSAPKRRISKTARWARAHKFMIYEVTDPELRSQLCYYRNKEKQQQEQLTTETK